MTTNALQGILWMLLTTLLTYGSLNENSEIKALKSIGVSVYRMILPGLILSVLMSFMTLLLNYY